MTASVSQLPFTSGSSFRTHTHWPATAAVSPGPPSSNKFPPQSRSERADRYTLH